METKLTKIYGIQQKEFQEGSSQQYLHQKTRKFSNKQSNSVPQGTRKRGTKPKISRRKEIIKIRAQTNKTETKKTIEDQQN